MTNITAVQIEKWFDSASRYSQGLLPELIRRLVAETVPREHIEELRIPTHDEVGRPGYDGIVRVQGTWLNVPDGRSVWEFSTSGDTPKRLAAALRDNYSKRAADELRGASTFTFVTPHAWKGVPSLDHVLAKCQAEAQWRDVCVLDRMTLESWMAVCPRTAGWLLREFTGSTRPIRDSAAYLEDEVQSRYRVHVPPSAIICGRDGDAEEVRTWVRGKDACLRVFGESPEEVCAFVASLALSESPGGESVADVVVFVESSQALEDLPRTVRPYVIVPVTAEAQTKVPSLVKQGARVILPQARLGRHQVAGPGEMVLGMMSREVLTRLLEEEIGIPRGRARDLARESKGSFAALMWELAEAGEAPAWTQGPAVPELVRILLAGQWNTQNADDRRAVEMLTGLKYDAVYSAVVEWQYPNGPLLRRGELVDWLAWPFAARHLAKHIDERLLARFADVVRLVLGETDPALGLAREERWLANVKGKVLRHSEALRSGLSDSLALLAVYGNELPGLNGQGLADSLVAELMPSKGDIAEKWYSVAPHFPEFAEAAPTVFLKRVESIATQPAVVALMFEEGGYVGPSSRHVHLLWALERTAWSKEHLEGSCLALGALAVADPGGNVSNRPLNSLVEVLLPWHPQTCSDVAGRLRALDALRSRHPQVAWDLAVRLFHGVTGIASGTELPRFRDWADDMPAATGEAYWETISGISARLAAWASEEPSRWAQILPHMPGSVGAGPAYDRLVGNLAGLDPTRLTPADRRVLADALRDLVAQHEMHAGAAWALNADQLVPYGEVLRRVEPDDPVARWQWLFAPWPNVPELRGDGIEGAFAELRKRRASAASEVHAQLGMRGVSALIEQAEDASAVGLALADQDMEGTEEAELLRAGLGHREESARTQKMLGACVAYVAETYRKRGDAWRDRVAGLRPENSEVAFLADLALGLPAAAATWEAIDKWGAGVSDAYWRRTNIVVLQDAQGDSGRAVEELVRIGRPYRALQLIALTEHRAAKAEGGAGPRVFSRETLQNVLLQLARHLPSDEQYGPDLSAVTHYVDRLFELLDEAAVDEATLVSLEFLLLPILRGGRRGPRAIHARVRTDARTFVELISLAFRAEDEEQGDRDIDPQKRAAATVAYQILDGLTDVPGAVYSELQGKVAEGEIGFAEGAQNLDTLRVWIDVARAEARAEKRAEICDVQIGHLLTHSPAERQCWPSAAVCEILEALGSDSVERGLSTGVFNKRGVHVRERGGTQERRIAERFRGFAAATDARWTRARAMLMELAREFERQAIEEDRLDEFEEFE